MTEVTNLGEPRVLHIVVENVNSMLVENVGRTQGCNHVEEGILVFVDKGRSREGSSLTELGNNYKYHCMVLY